MKDPEALTFTLEEAWGAIPDKNESSGGCRSLSCSNSQDHTYQISKDVVFNVLLKTVGGLLL